VVAALRRGADAGPRRVDRPHPELRGESRRRPRGDDDGRAVAASGGSYTAALALSGGLSIVGAAPYLLIVGRIDPLPIRSN